MEMISISFETEIDSILRKVVMRILMFGRGVIATIYGQALQAAGHDVEFFVRPGRASAYGDEVRTDIIDTRRKRRRQHVRGSVTTRLRESFGPEDQFDLIVVSVGHHRLTEAAEFIAPRIGAATVLVFGNVWDEPAVAVAPLPPAQVVFGFPQAGGGFDDDGVLHGALFHSVILGDDEAQHSVPQSTVRSAFRQAGFSVRNQPDIRGWLFIHFIADAGMFAEGDQDLGLAGMIGNRRAFGRALTISRDLLPILPARGVDVRRHRRALAPFRLTALVAAAMALATKRVPIARVSLAAHNDPNTIEARAIINDTLREAARLGIEVPLLESAARTLPPLQAARAVAREES